MLKKLKKSMLVAMSAMMVFQGLNPLSWFTGNFWPETEAAYYQDDNAGKYELTFTDPQGIIHREWVSLSGGVLSLEQGEKEGKIITSQVEPVSMRGWEVLKIDWTKPTGNEIRVNLLDCDSWEVIQWWNNIEYKEGGLPLTGSNLKWYKCLQTEVTLSREDEEYSSQMITKIELEYTVLPVLTSNIEPAKGTVEACSNLSYNVAYSNNYVTEMETVVYVELPSSEAWTITGYDEDIAKYPELNPTFVSATGWGKYTQTGLVLYNREIPANSVYWDIGVMDAGDTRLHSFTLNVPCGTMNGTKYQVSSSMNGKLSDLFISEQKEVIITASPYPTITKGASGLLYYKSKGYLFLGYNDSLNYSVYVSNGGTESMYVSKVVDDLSDVANKLETTCGGVSLQERVTHISDGGILEWTKITWELWTLKSRTNKTLTYDVNFSGCNVDGTTFKNTATLSSKNTEDKTAINIVELINNLKPDGNYSKSAWSTYYYGDVVSYTLRFRNTGPLRMEDFVFEDVLPDDVEYVSADIVSEHEWTVTVDGKKVTVNIEGCIDSPYFPSPSGSSCYRGPKEVIVVIKAQIKNKAICTPTTIRNSANFYANKTSVSYINDDNSMTGSPLQGTDSWSLVAKPLVGELRMGINGPRTLKPKEKGTYTINVSNIGKDTSKTTKLTIQIPKITVNGTEQYASISNIAWGIIDYTKVSQWIIQVDLEEILAWRSKQVSFELWPIPSGVFQGTKIDIAANVVGNDDVCGSFQSTTSMSNTFESEKRLYIRKTSRESYMLSAWEVEYQIIIQNMGTSPTTKTYIVDIVPNKAAFVEAYTTAITKEKEYSCEGCKVFFAKENINLPEKRDPYKPFNAGLISKYFEVGTEENGVWKSPYGENTKYVAYLVDDTATSLFPSGWEKMVGIKLKNNGTRIGALLTNVAWAFSRDLLQTIGNPKALTVLEYPGLKTEMNSTKEIISACESFDWEIPYVHDGNIENEITTLTVRLPNTVDLEEISHVWSSRSQTEGNLTGNAVGIKENSNVQITTINEETVISVNINGYLGYNLQPGWGGTLKVKVKAKCDTISDTIIIGTVVGHFKNAISYGDVSSEDDVQIKNADLYLRKNVDRRDPVYGETISYTLTIANKGERHASDVVIQDYLPEWVCYKSWSALVIQPGNRSIGEPFVEGDCGGSGQILTWSKSTNNALTQTEKTPGEIPGSSEDIYIRYSGIVDGDIPLWVSLINGAKVITADPQDNNYEKEDQQEIQVPYPSLYVEMESPRIVEWGWVFDYEIKYGNQSRMCANKTQLVLALPNQELGSSGITKLRAVVPNNGEEIYSLGCPYTSKLPIFNRKNPTEWGWTKGVVHNACYIAVKVPEEEFCSSHGQRKIVMSVQATNSLTNIKLPAGTQMTGEVNITNTRGDYDLTDNYSSSTTKIPAMDLWIEITGNPEGIFPGVLPNEVIDYTVTYGNYGNELSCANKIKVDIGENTKIESYDFVKLKIKDQRWVDMKLRKPTDEEIKEDVEVSVKTEKNSYVFDLWGEEVCFPGNSEGSFILSVRTSNGLNDSTPIIAEAEIWEESPAIEDTMENNKDESLTLVYLSDVIIEKTAIVDSDGNEIYGNTGDSKDMAKKGDHVKYSLKYDNIWNYAAENVVILETIPVDTCFKVGSIKVPQAANIQYSNDWWLTWDYSPQWNIDCQVTTIRIILKDVLSAPSNKIEWSFTSGSGRWEDLNPYPKTTNSSRDVVYFELDWENYIAFANDLTSFNEIWKRNGETYILMDNYPKKLTSSVSVIYYEIWWESYLAFANNGNPNEIWRRNGEEFLEVSGLPSTSNPSHGIVYYEIWWESYLAFSSNGKQNEIWKRNGETFILVWGNPSTTYQSYGVEYYNINGENYLVFANWGTDNEIWKRDWNKFISYTSIPSTNKSLDVKFYKIWWTEYLAFSNYGNPNEIWKRNGGNFTLLQDNPSTVAQSYRVMPVVINEINYLIYANRDQSNEIRKWNWSNYIALTAGVDFPNTSIPSLWMINYELQWELYFVFANYDNNPNEIWKRNGSKFENIGDIYPQTTRASRDVCPFLLDGENYVAVANRWEANELWKWDWNRYIETGLLPSTTRSSVGCITYTIDNQDYLFFWNYGSDSELFKWNGSTYIQLSNAPYAPYISDTFFYEMNGEYYIALSSDNWSHRIWKRDGSQYTLYQSISSNIARWVTSYEISGDHFLAFAVWWKKANEIYKLNGTKYEKFVNVPNTYNDSRWVESFFINNRYYLVFSTANADVNEIWERDGEKYITLIAGVDFPNTTNKSQDVEVYELAGKHYLVFTNESAVKEIWERDWTKFIALREWIFFPNSISFWRRIEQYEMEGNHYLVSANQGTVNEIRKFTEWWYMTSGENTKVLRPNKTVIQRNKLYLDYTNSLDAVVTMSLYNNASLYGTPLVTEINPWRMIDLNNLSYTGTLYLHIAIEGDGVEMKDYSVTFYSEEKSEITLEAVVREDKILWEEIINTARITTTTPEISTENNESSHILYTESTDLVVTKTVDKSVAWAGDNLKYTITYENKGPKNAKNVLISDKLPEGVEFISSTPQLTTPGYENGAWHLDYTTDGYASEISFELIDGAGTILAQKTRSTHNSNNTTFTFTGQITTAGTITMSRRDSYGDGDGNYKLYLDGDLILEWAKRSNTQTTETKTYEGFIPQIKGYDLVIPELPVGSGWTIEILAKITTGASQGSIYTNTVEISSSTAEDRPEDNKAIAITTLGEVANLFTNLELSPRYTPNGEVKIILNYGNNGNKNTEQTNLMLTVNPYMTLKSSTHTGYTMSWSTLKRELWMQDQQEEKQIELIFQIANDQSLLENDVALEVNALISSITPEVNLLDNKSVATSIPSEGWMVSLEWQVYIDVDKTNNLTENDTKLQSQTVNFLGLTTKWITITGEIQTDVEGKYQIINLDPGTYELQIVPNIGYETVYSKAGYNLDNEIKGKGSLEGWTDKRKIIEIKWYSEERIQGLDFALDNKELTNVYTNIKLAGYTDVVSLDVEYGNTTTIPAAWTTLKISLDPNVIYKGSSNKNLVYQEDKHELLFNIWNLTTKDNHFTINVEIDSSKLTEETIRYHSFNFVSTIETKTLPEITKLDNISTIDQRIVMVGDVSGKVYLDKDGVLGWNEDKDEVLSGYTVELRSMSWTVEKTVTTSSTGYYEFINIKPGLYQLVVPETWHYQSLASFPGIIGATAITTGESLNISTIQLEVNSATTYENFDFSLKLLPSSLGGKISLSNGLPLEYIEVLLQNDNWEQEKSFTNASGDYVFAVEAGTYSLSYILPPAYVAHIASVGNLGGNILSDQEINEIVIDYDQQGINYDFILRAESQQIQGTVYKVDENGGFLKPAGWVVVYLNNQTQQHSLQVIEGFNTLLSIGKENSEKVWIITKEEIITEDKTKAEDLLASGELTESEVILYGEITPESIAELETASTTDQIVDSMEEISSESDKLEPSNKAEVLQSGEENLETKWSDEQTTTLSTQETQETVTQQKIQNLSTTQVLPLSAVDMVITDDQGRYNFTVTEAGNYYITHNVPLPQLSHEAYPGKNPETGISNAHKISEKEIEVEILAGDSSIQNNFAVKSPQTAINVGVYYDANDDGTYEYGIDQLLSWVTVSIYKEGKQIWVGLTLPEAGYVFKEMEAGTYDVVYTLPNWYIAKSQQKITIQLWNSEIQDVYFPVQKKTLYDLGVQKTVDKTNANPGDTLVYTITVRNLGNIVVGKDILVRDVWPQWLEYISDDGKFSSYKDGEERVFKIPTLDAWATEIITLTAKVPTTATDATVYTNGVKVISGSPKETNLLNNESYVSTTISKKGSSTWWGNGGGPNPLLPDECPDGDYSPSFYDKTCWEKPPKEECEGDSCKEQEHGSPETPKPNEENKVVIIESDDEYLGTKDFKNPWELPKTWPEELIFRRAKVIKSSNVYVAYPDWFKPSTNDDIEYWKQVLPYAMDRYESAYIVLPKMWAIAPIREMEDYSDKSLYLNGEVEKVDVNKYLKRGVLHYPWSAKYGETGNAVIVGHSSYFNKDNGRYKTVFQSIIGLNQGDVIRIYQLNKDGKYDKYEYIVERSYETGSKDVGVLEPGYGRNLTLITCIPIGTVSSRWVVQAKIPAKTIQIVKEVKK